MQKEKNILHIDMDNCFASIEAVLNPKLKGKQVAVCGSTAERHGIVLAKSQEAKMAGVKTGEVIWQAKQKAKNLIIVPPQYDKYIEFSQKARNIYLDFTNKVEAFGIDECWLDVTGAYNLFGDGVKIAKLIKERIKKELKITVSIGVSFNKIFAKMASDYNKPDGLTVVTRDNFKKMLWPLEINRMMGVGHATKKRLNKMGVYTIGELAKIDTWYLEKSLGVNGVYLQEYAKGLDKNPVENKEYRTKVKSVSRGMTLKEDILNKNDIRNVFQELAFDVSKTLRENAQKAAGIQITVKDSEFSVKQYQSKLDIPSQSSIYLAESSEKLFFERHKFDKPIRSLTLSGIDLVDEHCCVQLNLFSDYDDYMKKEELDKVIYKIREKYGASKATFLSSSKKDKIPKMDRYRKNK